MNSLRDRYTDNLLGLLQFKAIDAQQFASSLSRFSVVPNSITSSSGGSPSEQIATTFTSYHGRYKEMIGVDGPASGHGAGVKIAILDSGIASQHDFNVLRTRNFASRGRSTGPGEGDAADLFGHGTVVASIIKDIAPEAELIVYKVLDLKGRGTEWEAIAGLLTIDDVDIVNMSLQFGHDKLDCKECGRRTSSSRSVVFEQVLELVRQHGGNPLVVAAAGNLHDAALTFPARFPNVIAVGALDAQGARARYSNYGARDNTGEHHQNLFFLPGGEPDSPEKAVAYAGHRSWWGTSFACAYASAIITIMLSVAGRSALPQHLRATAVRNMADYNEDDDGNGMMVLTMPRNAPWM